MRYFSVFLFLAFIVLNSCSSNEEKSSNELAKRENNAIAADTTQIKELLQRVEALPESEYDSASTIINNALKLSEEANYTDGKIDALHKLGDLSSKSGFSYRATDYYLRALAISEAYNKQNKQLTLTKKIGDNYLVDDFERAIFYFNKRLELCKKIADEEQRLLTINDLGIAHFIHNNLDSANIYFERCLTENNKLQSIKIFSAATTNLGIVLSKQKEYQKAIEQLNKAIPYAKVDGYGDTVPFIKNELSKIYLIENNTQQASRLVNEAIEEIPSKYINLNTDIIKTLANVQEKSGDLSSAFSSYKTYTNRKLKEDSLKNEQISKLLNLSFQNEEQLESLNKLNIEIREKEYRNTLISVAVVFLLILAALLIYLFRLQKAKVELINRQKSDIENLNTALENKVKNRTAELLKANGELVRKNTEISEALFKGQTIERERVAAELHDNLGSTLTALKWQFQAINKKTLSTKEQKIYEQVLNTIQETYSNVRLLSHNLLPAELSTKGLVGALQKLIDDLNSSGVMSFNLKANNGFSINDKRVSMEIYSCCLEAITNAIKHSGAKNVLVRLTENYESHLITVEDDGIGMSSTLDHGKGIKSIRNRVAKVSGTVEITRPKSKPNGTLLIIQLPKLQSIK